MQILVGALFVALFVAGYLVAPIMLVWGWARWAVQPRTRTVPSFLSLIALIFSTASALLAICTTAYALVRPFRFYDPLLLRIYRWGILLSLAGIIFGICGLWRHSSLRWHAPTSAVATLAFWIVTASME